MNITHWLKSAEKKLLSGKIPTARLDVLVLLADAFNQDKAWVLAHPETEISHTTEVKLNNKITQRANHVPLAYIRGQAEFYGRDFYVDEAVLVPRPETEATIDLLKRTPFVLQGALPLHFVDIGTGSGCIGITAALEMPQAQVELRDVSPSALAVAAGNAKRHGVKAKINQADLLEHPPMQYVDALLANLPYVPDGYAINQAARHEPKLALFAGKDGLDLYHRFWRQVGGLTEKPLYIFTESWERQHNQLKDMAHDAGYDFSTTQGLAQQFKRR